MKSGMNAVSAGGRGAHGISSPIGPDPLFAQGAVKVNADAGVLVTVNVGTKHQPIFRHK